VNLPTALSLSLALVFAAHLRADEIEVQPDIAYKSGTLTDYEQERCKLDLYLPAKREGFATLVWFHGGGLTGGGKDKDSTPAIARSLAGGGIAVAVANYRLSPKAKYPAYVEDAAAAFAWVHSHIAEHGGAAKRVFIGGHSAGAYLTSMVGLDPQYLTAFGLKPEAIAGLIPVSGQMMTHYTIRVERDLPKERIIADEAAPIYYVAKQTRPIFIIMGDHDWPARLEENLYFVAAMKVAKNNDVQFLKVEDRTHGSIAGKMVNADDPARRALLEFIELVASKRAPSP
jgi:acetyl esterase/lipase